MNTSLGFFLVDKIGPKNRMVNGTVTVRFMDSAGVRFMDRGSENTIASCAGDSENRVSVDRAMDDGGGARGHARAWEEHARTRRDQRDGMWQGAVATVMVVGVVLVSVVCVDQWSAAETARAMRQQQLRLAAQKVEATGSKLVSALATWSHHREEPASRGSTGAVQNQGGKEFDAAAPWSRSADDAAVLDEDKVASAATTAVAAEVAPLAKVLARLQAAHTTTSATSAPLDNSEAKAFIAGKDRDELKWVLHRSSELAQELKSSDKAKRRAVESLAIQRAKTDVEEKDMAVVTDELAQLRQEVKDRDGEVTSARARIAKGEEALFSKELELAEVKKELSKCTATEKELLSKELEIAELKKQLSLHAATDKEMLAATIKEHCQCQKDKAQILKSIMYTAFTL